MTEMLVSELTMYWLGTAVLALAAAGLTAWAFRLDRRVREYGLAAAAAAAFVALGYVLMATDTLTLIEDGERSPFGRFVGYAFMFGIVDVIIWRISGASRVWLGVLVGVTYLWIGSVIVHWLGTGQTELLALGGILFAFLGVIFTLLRPLSTAAGAVAGERRLLFGKLRNFTVMVLVLYLVVSVVSDQGVGVLDTFVGVFVVVYLDVVFVIGMAVLVLRAETALGQVVGGDGDDSDGADEEQAAGDEVQTGGGAGGSDPTGGVDDGVTIADPSATAAE